jgi:hypothetical protein
MNLFICKTNLQHKEAENEKIQLRLCAIFGIGTRK